MMNNLNVKLWKQDAKLLRRKSKNDINLFYLFWLFLGTK